MDIITLLSTSLGLAMDAFAVAVCKGLALKKATVRQALLVGVWFGGFQALMPLVGFWLGSNFQSLIENIDHWIAFILLGIIGFNMIRESREEAETVDASFSVRAMFPLAVATSIDALAVGITFSFLKVSIIPAVSLIGITTFILSAIGLVLGNRFGCKYKSKAEVAGGIILILIGTKILLEHTGILA